MSAVASLTLAPARHAPPPEAEQRPLDFGLIRRLLAYTRPHRRLRNWLLLMVLLRAVQLPALAWMIGAVINGPISRGDPLGTLRGALAFAALAAVTQLTFHFRQRLALELGENVTHDLRDDIYAHLLAMPLGFFQRTKLGRIISRLTSDVDAVRSGVQDVLFVGVVGLGQMVVAALFMLWQDWTLFLVVAGMTPVLWALNQLFRRRFSDAARATQESFSRITATLAEAVSGIRVTQGFARQARNTEAFRELAADHSHYNLDMARAAGVFLPLLELSTQFFIAILLLLGGYHVLGPHPRLAVGTLVQFFFLAGVFFGPLQTLGNLYHQALTAMAGAERIFRLLDTPPDWSDPPTARALSQVHGRVECQDLTFGYEPERPVLRNIAFVAEAGQTVALVGPTGSGKTTLVKLIAKFYLPDSGRVLLDGTDLREIRAEALHQHMAIIQQENFLFTGTVMANIRIGRPTASDADILAAAQRLDCLDLLQALPEGFQTPVGEHGAALSLGQRQLICFLRALVADPRILILDEATSAVDTFTEMRIQKALATLLQGRTCFVIAHRLSTVRHADQVLVLDGGRIVERGTHPQLLAQRGLYSRLYRQFVRVGLGGRPASPQPQFG